MRKINVVILVCAIISVFAGCSSIDCSLNSLVLSNYEFRTAYGTPDTLRDTLTVTTHTLDGDTVLLNRATDITGFSLPVSYVLDSDTLAFHFTRKDGTTYTDSLIMKKTNISHFESVDCPPTFFHDIEDLALQGERIDSLRVNDKRIDNGTEKKNIYIYLKSVI